MRCYDDLSRLLWGLDGLPRPVCRAGAHPVLRYTEVRSREPFPLGDTPSASPIQFSPFQLPSSSSASLLPQVFTNPSQASPLLL